MLEQVRKVRLAVLACLFAILAVPQVSAAQVTDISDIKLEYFYPALVAFAVAIPVWRWFIPNQLANLQVAFEIDDDCMKFTGSPRMWTTQGRCSKKEVRLTELVCTLWE